MSNLEMKIQYLFFYWVSTKAIEIFAKVNIYNTLSNCPGLNPAAKTNVQISSKDDKN